MEQETAADKLAKKSFHGKRIQASWNVHMQAFEPVLAPAFVEDYQARIHLTNALNKLSKFKVEESMDLLKLIEPRCRTDADKAAWYYFMGLCYDRSVFRRKEMLAMYREAERYGNRFYLPYLRMAKIAHLSRDFEGAEGNYRKAIGCLRERELGEQERTALSSAYLNLCSCLTMMHRYEEALSAMEAAKQIQAQHPGRDSTEAILYAAMGDEKRTEELVEALAVSYPAFLSETVKMTSEILAGTHAQFHPVEIDGETLDTFWTWFSGEQGRYVEILTAGEQAAILEELQKALMPVAACLERAPDLHIRREDGKIHICLADFFAVGPQGVYKALLERMPRELKENWSFEIVHY